MDRESGKRDRIQRPQRFRRNRSKKAEKVSSGHPGLWYVYAFTMKIALAVVFLAFLPQQKPAQAPAGALAAPPEPAGYSPEDRQGRVRSDRT